MNNNRKILLNDLLNLPIKDEIKVKFNSFNGYDNPLETYLKDPDGQNERWTAWRGKSGDFKIGWKAIILMHMRNDLWLLTSIREITGDTGIPESNAYSSIEIPEYKKYYGRIVIRAGKLFRTLKAFSMYWHAQGMKTLYSGSVIANGVKYSVYPERSFGYADKNWGEDFTSPWVWLSSCDLTSRISGNRLLDSVFDIGGGCPVVFGIPLRRKLLSAFYYEGEEFEFNFSKFWTLTRTKFRCKETADAVIWHVRQQNRTALIDVNVKCLKKDMLLINYEAPNGSKKHNRLWNGGNGRGIITLYEKHPRGLYLIDEIRCEHVGCEYGVYDEK